MTSKNDTQNRPHEQNNEAGQPVSRRRLKAFIKRLEKDPQLLAQFEAIAAIADAGGDARTQTADEIESRILEATRKLSRRTFTHWAAAAQERAIEDCKMADPCARVKSGASSKVIATLGKHREPEEVGEENAPVRSARRYLGNRTGTLDYQSALEAGLPIGSGLIESGHKHVLQARLKIPGAAWCKTNAQIMFQLRVLHSNHRWHELWLLAA